jgi:hypothetical protein
MFLRRYDFDRDGYIIREDVKLILSHIPITNTVAGKVAEEGAFTQEGGGSQVRKFSVRRKDFHWSSFRKLT